MKSSRKEKLFKLVLEQSAENRGAFLDAVCGNDDSLREDIESMLSAYEHSFRSHSPEKSTSDTPPERLHAEGPGKVIDRYKLLEKVGEGGFGVVFVAEQKHPIKRRVALKIIKMGMDTKQVVARFEAERQALAMMDHPNIAKVLDAGATETGRPYFVMELVRGIPITDYCDQEKLSTKKRLDLFIHVCHAIQHAHQKGIIHRDVKPSNIMVTMHDGVPVPKVIDFGIAKAIQQDLTDKTVYTRLQQFVGTPAYISPEQAEMSGLDIDTRSDIYSLGVLLYELLTGRTPFDPEALLQKGIDAMRKMIRETEPPKPSTKVATLAEEDRSTTAARRAVEVPKLIGLLKGDLDWIVMKCLEKNRTRRYETANGLAMDLQRYFNHEPVLARPPSVVYRFQKAWRRNKVVYTAAMLVVLSLVVGIAISLWQTRRAQMLRVQAQQQELSARQQAYASNMNVAKQALEISNFGQALNLLNQQRPNPDKPDEIDLRGWEWRYLWKQTRSDALFTLCQEFEIFSLAISSDANWLAIGMSGLNGRVSLSVWDLLALQETALPRLAENQENVRVAFSPNEPLLAITSDNHPNTGDRRSTLHLWNITTRQTIVQRTLDNSCWGLAFSEDGRRLVTITLEGQITLWSIPELTQLGESYPCKQFVHTVGPVVGFATTADLSLAAYAWSNRQVCVVNLSDGSPLWTKVAAKQYVTALAFSPDGQTLASAGGYAESDIRLWDVATGEEKSGRLEDHKNWVSSLVFWPDGKKLASGSGDQTIRIWDVAKRECVDILRGHKNEVWLLALLPDGKTLVSGCKDGTVCLWDTSVTHMKPPRITIRDVQAWCFTSDSRSVLTLSPKGQVTRWEGDDFKQRTLVLDIGGTFNRGLFSPDGRYLATGSSNGVISIWDISQQVLWRQLGNEPGEIVPGLFFAQGRKLTTLSGDTPDIRLYTWDLGTGRKQYSWRVLDIPPVGAISPDSELAIVIGLRGDLLTADLSNGGDRALGLDPIEVPSDAAFSPDGGLFAISSFGGLVQVCSTDTWQEKKRLGGYMQGLISVTFSPDGSRLVSGGDQHEALKFWDTRSWRDVLTLEGDGSDFRYTSFSPDGNTIGSANLSGTLHLWRAPSWNEINIAETKDKMDLRQP